MFLKDKLYGFGGGCFFFRQASQRKVRLMLQSYILYAMTPFLPLIPKVMWIFGITIPKISINFGIRIFFLIFVPELKQRTLLIMERVL